jgi:Flp pilus assembly protein TadB
VKQQTPVCPVCGSSATLPFESDDAPEERQSVAEIVFGTLLIFLTLFLVLLVFLLSRASLPSAVLLLMAAFLFWRRQREKHRQAKKRPRPYVCLDCSHNFMA